LWREITDGTLEILASEPALRGLVESLENKVYQGLESPYAAAARVLAALRGKPCEGSG
jgi:hypothetical protein